jgi:hypothetical protein
MERIVSAAVYAFVLAAFGGLAYLVYYLIKTYSKVNGLFFFGGGMFLYVLLVMAVFQWRQSYLNRLAKRGARHPEE